MTEPLSASEEKVAAAVRESRDELVGLVQDLVACDTTARNEGDPPRDEVKLQEILATRLRAVGADVELWEPEPTGKGNRHLPDDLDFKGRPQLVARVAGQGGGRSLLLNGHIDAVTPEPRDQWESDPFRAELRDGILYGRGVSDMKGGVAAMMLAVETLHRLGVKLRGDLVYCTVTDEESSGAGGWAAARHGVRADAGICGEPTDFAAWVACRGTLNPVITVEGRAGHAEIRQPHWREGGAVNAIEKMQVVCEAIQALREEWLTRPDKQHPFLSPGDILPVLVEGGIWVATYPPSCTMTCSVQYLPANVDADGTGRLVEREVQEWIDRAAAADPWLAEHPLQWQWTEDIMPAEIPADHPLVEVTLGAASELGRTGSVAGLDSWHDAATFTQHGTPTFSYGPGGGETAHAVNERVPVDDLADACAITAMAAMRFCGVAQ